MYFIIAIRLLRVYYFPTLVVAFGITVTFIRASSWAEDSRITMTKDTQLKTLLCICAGLLYINTTYVLISIQLEDFQEYDLLIPGAYTKFSLIVR